MVRLEAMVVRPLAAGVGGFEILRLFLCDGIHLVWTSIEVGLCLVVLRCVSSDTIPINLAYTPVQRLSCVTRF